MAVRNSTSHASQFINQLNRNERNSLRVLLLTKSGARLCKALLDRITESSSHPRDGHRILSLPPNRGKTKEGSQAAMTAAKLWK
jgi:hypothetical protein